MSECVQLWQESVCFQERQKNPYPICLRCAVLVGGPSVVSVVGACSFHCMQIMLGLQLAGFLHSVETVFSLFAENANWQISGGQEPELEIWPVVPGHEMCIGLTGGPQYTSTLMLMCC